MNQEVDKELQRANEVFVLLEGCLPNGLKGKFDKVKNDPSPFPKQRPTCAHLRILPTIREVPEKFWDSTWCFYQLSVGSELAGSVACVDFRHAPGNAECGHGEHSAAVSRILAATALRLKAQGFETHTPETSKGKPYFRLRRLYKGSPAYRSFGHFPPPEDLARDLAALIAHTYPAFVDYAESTTR